MDNERDALTRDSIEKCWTCSKWTEISAFNYERGGLCSDEWNSDNNTHGEDWCENWSE